MSHFARWHHKPEVLQAQHNWNLHFNPPVPLTAPNFHTAPVYRDAPFYDFEPVNEEFKTVCAETATEVVWFEGDESPEQALINLWQATDTLDEFVGHLAAHIDITPDGLVAVAHAFERSIEDGLDEWEARQTDLLV